MSDANKPLLERVKREWYDNPLRNVGMLLSLLLSSIALVISIYWNGQREPKTPYAHIEAAAFSNLSNAGKSDVVVEWHNDHSTPIVMVDNDLRLFDASGHLMPVTCCNEVNTKADQMNVEIMPGKAVLSQLENTARPAAVWACMIFKRPGEETRYAIQKVWKMRAAVSPDDSYSMQIDPDAIGKSVLQKLVCR